MAQALGSPFNNGPQSLQSPVVGQAQAQAPLPTPPPAQAPAPQPQAQALEQATPDLPHDFMSYQPQAKSGDNDLPHDFMAYQPTEQQGPVEGTIFSRNSATGTGLVKKPDGSFGVMTEGGQVRDLTSDEKKAASYAAKALRIGGPTVGGILGSALGLLTGPAAGVAVPAGGAAGATGGGEAVHPAASFLETVAGEKPQERTNTQRVAEAAGGALGPILGKLAAGGASQLPGLAKVGAEEASSALVPSAEAGAQAINQQAGERLQAAKDVNLPIMSHQVNAENPAITAQAKDVATGRFGETEANKLLAAQKAQNQAHLEAWDKLSDQIGPSLSEEGQKGFSLKNVVDDLAGEHEKDISGLKAKAYLAAGNEPKPVLELSSKIENTLQKTGILNPDGSLPDKINPEARTLVNQYLNFKDTAGAQGGKGMTLKQLDNFVQTAQTNANFSSASRSPIERAWGEISHDAVAARDEAAASAFDKVGDVNSAEALRQARTKYSNNIDAIRTIQGKLEQDPSLGNAVAAVVKRNNPGDVQKLMNLVTPEQHDTIARAFLDNIVKGKIESGGRVNASSIENELSKYDPKALDTMLGGNRKDLQKLINYGKVIEKTQLTPENVANNKSVQGFTDLASTHGWIRRAGDLVTGLLKKNPTANDFIQDQLVKKFPVDVGASKYAGVRQALGQPGVQAAAAGVGAAQGATLGGLLAPKQNNQ